MEAPILIPPNWKIGISCAYICIIIGNRSNITHNPIGKYDHTIVYASRWLNKAKYNYTIVEKETLAMVYALHEFRHFLLGNKFVFYVEHMRYLMFYPYY
jgi:hypothetical protein